MTNHPNRSRKIGEKPTLHYRRDGERYIVMLGDDRAGFVIQMDNKRWNAVDSTMAKSRNFDTRDKAGSWLQKETERAIAAGEV